MNYADLRCFLVRYLISGLIGRRATLGSNILHSHANFVRALQV